MMCSVEMDLDERVWALMDRHTPREIAAIIDLPLRQVTESYVRLTRTRGSPGLIALGETIAELRVIAARI